MVSIRAVKIYANLNLVVSKIFQHKIVVKNRRGSYKMNFKNLITESGENSNIKLKHFKRRIDAVRNGFSRRYNGKSKVSSRERKLHWAKHIWWTITIVTAVALWGFCINQIYLKLSPLVITFEDESTPISKINFPTITLCNPIKVLPRILHYSYINHQILTSNYTYILTKNVIQQMYALSSFCKKDVILEYIKRNNITIDRNIWPYLQQVFPVWMDSYCSLLPGQQFDCKKAFVKTLNNFGICYSFNHLSSDEIYSKELADDFPKFKQFFIAETNTTYPYRVKKATQGISEITILFPKSERQINPNCNAPFDKDNLFLFIHPADDQHTKEIPIPLDHWIHVSVRPNQISTDRKLINKFWKHERKCVAIEENNLKFYRKYSQNNCYYEKLILHIISECKCAYFWMPRWNDTSLCSASDIQCFNEKLASFANIDLLTECMPACNSLIYDAKITEIKPNDRYMYEHHRFIKIQVGFDDQQYLFMKRSEIYGTVDFYVGCAGTFSLFMGVSFLSICKKLYHVTFRPFLDRRKTTKKIRCGGSEGGSNRLNRVNDRSKKALTITITLKPKMNGNATNKY